MATREPRALPLHESDDNLISQSEDGDDANSGEKEKNEIKRWTDLIAKDLDPHLPIELATNILSRISGRALLKMLPTCKDWWSLTKDAFFIDLHLSNSVRLMPPSIIMIWHEETEGQQRYHFDVVNHLWEPQFSLIRESGPISVTNSCSGLICIYDESSITMCNPTTQKFMNLPRATPTSAILSNMYPDCSLGFDPISKKYKVVRFFYRKVDHSNQSCKTVWFFYRRARNAGHFNKNYNVGCEVFTQGATCWKTIAFIHCHPIGRGVNVKGSIYWRIASSSKLITDRIMALDLTSESFMGISLLETRSQSGNDDEHIYLAKLEGNLCVIYTRFIGYTTVDIWMLGGYSGNVWIHKCHIRLPAEMKDLRYKIVPIAMYDGKVIFKIPGWRFYEYKLQTGNITNVYNAQGSLLELPLSCRASSPLGILVRILWHNCKLSPARFFGLFSLNVSICLRN